MNKRTVEPGQHYSSDTLDRWRCGLLPVAKTTDVEAHVAACIACRKLATFGTRVVVQLDSMAVPAGRRRVARTAPWRRMAAGGGLIAVLALTGIVVVPRWTTSAAPADTARASQVSDVVQHQHFYAWLAAHPQLLQGQTHGTSA